MCVCIYELSEEMHGVEKGNAVSRCNVDSLREARAQVPEATYARINRSNIHPHVYNVNIRE